jgi:hypothetical protein
MEKESAVALSKDGEMEAIKGPVFEVGIVPKNMIEAMQLADIIARSDIVPANFKDKPGNVLVAMQMGAEIGLKPMQALQNIAVINGRPSVWGDALLAIVKAHPSCEFIEETVQNGVATCTVKRKGQQPVNRVFSVEDAKTAKLWGKVGPWTQYPNRMLQMRARGFALRDVWPDLLRGIFSAEESRDIPPDETWKEYLEPDDNAPKTATEKLKSKLKKQASDQPNPKLETVLDAIKNAENMEQLRATGNLGKGLNTKDKATAKEAYTAKSTELKAAAPEQTSLPQGNSEDLKAKIVEGVSIIGDQAWECIRAEESLPKSLDDMTGEQLGIALKRIDQKATLAA